MLSKHTIFRFPFFATAIMLLSAGAAAEGVYPQSYYSPRVPKDVKTIGVVILNYRAYYLTAGGIDEYTDTISTLGAARLSACLQKSLVEKKFVFKPIALDTADTSIQNLECLYKAVCREIELHVLGSSQFVERITHFDYAIGSISELCKAQGVDAIMFVMGYDETSTSLRRQVAAQARAAAIASAIIGSIIGFGGGSITLRSDLTFLSAGLVVPSGTLCWFRKLLDYGDIDMCRHADADKELSDLLGTLPVSGGGK
jgi:hypothetical protein